MRMHRAPHERATLNQRVLGSNPRRPTNNISRRYERGSIAFTTSRVCKHWPEIFNHDATLTSAVLDRLLRHAETVTLEGRSFRMKGVIDR